MLISAISALVLVGLCSLVTGMGWVKPLFIPSLLLVLKTFYTTARDGFAGDTLLMHTWASFPARVRRFRHGLRRGHPAGPCHDKLRYRDRHDRAGRHALPAQTGGRDRQGGGGVRRNTSRPDFARVRPAVRLDPPISACHHRRQGLTRNRGDAHAHLELPEEKSGLPETGCARPSRPHRKRSARMPGLRATACQA